MSGYGFGWRVGVVAFVILELSVVGLMVVAEVVTDWHGLLSVPVLVYAGVLVGCWIGGLLVPVCAAFAAAVGTIAGVRHGSRRRRLGPA